MSNDSQCVTWDFTLFKGQRDELPSSNDVVSTLLTFCKAYAFQMEKCPKTGNLHYQGRVKLMLKERESGVKGKFNSHPSIYGAKITRTSTENMNNMFYCMKEETRVSGPWTDQDKPELKVIQKMTDNGLLHWQGDLEAQLLSYDDRQIDVLIDPVGNNGKSSFKKWMYVKHDACIVPAINDSKDIMQWCMGFPGKKLYIIDMPRAMKKKSLYQLYAGIEQLKDGYMFDTRYNARFRLIDEPRILVMTNYPPKKRYLSLDRWRMWTIIDGVLRVYKYPEVVEK